MLTLSTPQTPGALVAADASLPEILRAALRVLCIPINADGNGWQQGGYGERDGCKCVSGAIRLVVTGRTYGTATRRVDAAEKLLMRAVRKLGHIRRSGGVWAWNDTEGRTFAEVRDAFNAAIADCTAKAGVR